MTEAIYEVFMKADLVGTKRGRAGFLLKDSAKRRKRKIQKKSQVNGPNPEDDVVKQLMVEVEALKEENKIKDAEIKKMQKFDL